MISLQTDIFDVSSANDTVLVIREVAQLTRPLVFRNLSASTITVQIQYSADGTTWTNDSAAFSLGIAGSGTEIAIKLPTSLQMLRIQASGGSDSKELEIGMLRLSIETDPSWVKPAI